MITTSRIKIIWIIVITAFILIVVKFAIDAVESFPQEKESVGTEIPKDYIALFNDTAKQKIDFDYIYNTR